MIKDIFQAIADPTTRRTILGLLAVHSMTPNAMLNILIRADKQFPNTLKFYLNVTF